MSGRRTAAPAKPLDGGRWSPSMRAVLRYLYDAAPDGRSVVAIGTALGYKKDRVRTALHKLWSYRAVEQAGIGPGRGAPGLYRVTETGRGKVDAEPNRFRPLNSRGSTAGATNPTSAERR